MTSMRCLILRLHVALLAVLIPDLSRIVSLRVLLRLFTPRRPGRLYAGLSEQRITALIVRQLRNPWRMRGRRCLRVGLLTFYFLRLAGVSAELRFGVFTRGGPRELAHCWVTFQGQCLTEPPRDAYVPILTWGESAARQQGEPATKPGSHTNPAV